MSALTRSVRRYICKKRSIDDDKLTPPFRFGLLLPRSMLITYRNSRSRPWWARCSCLLPRRTACQSSVRRPRTLRGRGSAARGGPASRLPRRVWILPRARRRQWAYLPWPHHCRPLRYRPQRRSHWRRSTVPSFLSVS